MHRAEETRWTDSRPLYSHFLFIYTFPFLAGSFFHETRHQTHTYSQSHFAHFEWARANCALFSHRNIVVLYGFQPETDTLLGNSRTHTHTQTRNIHAHDFMTNKNAWNCVNLLPVTNFLFLLRYHWALCAGQDALCSFLIRYGIEFWRCAFALRQMCDRANEVIIIGNYDFSKCDFFFSPARSSLLSLLLLLVVVMLFGDVHSPTSQSEEWKK